MLTPYGQAKRAEISHRVYFTFVLSYHSTGGSFADFAAILVLRVYTCVLRVCLVLFVLLRRCQSMQAELEFQEPGVCPQTTDGVVPLNRLGGLNSPVLEPARMSPFAGSPLAMGVNSSRAH